MKSSHIFFKGLSIEFTNQQKKELNEADDKFLGKQIEEAIELYQKFIDCDRPDQQHPIYGLGSIADQKGYYEKRIIEWYRDLKTHAPHNIPAYDSLSLCFSINKDYRSAENYYRDMISKYSSNNCFRFGLANIFFNCGRIVEAKQQYKKIHAANPDFKHAIKQLAMISFYEDNYEEVNRYLAKIQQQIQSDAVLSLVRAMTLQSNTQKISGLNSLINNHNYYPRALVFKSSILLSEEKYLEAKKCLEQCIRKDTLYILPYIELAKLYCDQKDCQAAIKCLEQGSKFKWDGDLLVDLYLCFLYMGVNQYNKANQCIKRVISQLESKELALMEDPAKFLKGQFDKIKEATDKHLKNHFISQETSRQLTVINKLIKRVHSIKQQHLNMRIQRILQKEPTLLEFISDVVEQGYRLDKQNLFGHLEHLCHQKSENIVHLISIMLARFISLQLAHHSVNIQQVEIIISRLLREAISSESIFKDEQMRKNKNKNQYKIEYTGRKFNCFEKQEFKDYKHLFFIIKKFNKNEVKQASSLVQNIFANIEESNPPAHYHIKYKLDTKNLDFSVNQLIQEIMPELKEKKYKILQESWNKTQRKNNIQSFVNCVNQQLQAEISNEITVKFQKKQPLQFIIDNWIQVDCSFSSGKKLKEAVHVIERDCHSHNYQITNVRGDFDDKWRNGIVIYIRINKVCCQFNFFLTQAKKELILKQYITKMLKFKLGCVFYSLFEIGKQNYQPLIAEIKNQLQSMEFPEQHQSFIKVQNINMFLEGLQGRENLGNDLTTERSYYLDTSDITQGNQPERKLLKCSTGLFNQFRTDRIQNNCYKSTIQYAPIRQKEVKIEKEKDRKQHVRYHTDGNDLLKEDGYFNVENFKFHDESNDQDSISQLSKSFRICKSIIDLIIKSDRQSAGQQNEIEITQKLEIDQMKQQIEILSSENFNLLKQKQTLIQKLSQEILKKNKLSQILQKTKLQNSQLFKQVQIHQQQKKSLKSSIISSNKQKEMQYNQNHQLNQQVSAQILKYKNLQLDLQASNLQQYKYKEEFTNLKKREEELVRNIFQMTNEQNIYSCENQKLLKQLSDLNEKNNNLTVALQSANRQNSNYCFQINILKQKSQKMIREAQNNKRQEQNNQKLHQKQNSLPFYSIIAKIEQNLAYLRHQNKQFKDQRLNNIQKQSHMEAEKNNQIIQKLNYIQENNMAYNSQLPKLVQSNKQLKMIIQQYIIREKEFIQRLSKVDLSQKTQRQSLQNIKLILQKQKAKNQVYQLNQFNQYISRQKVQQSQKWLEQKEARQRQQFIQVQNDQMIFQCEGTCDSAQKMRKKIEYLKILIIILMFEAITITFSAYIFT